MPSVPMKDIWLQGWQVKHTNGQMYFLRGPWSSKHFNQLKVEADAKSVVAGLDHEGNLKALAILDLEWNDEN